MKLEGLRRKNDGLAGDSQCVFVFNGEALEKSGARPDRSAGCFQISSAGLQKFEASLERRSVFAVELEESLEPGAGRPEFIDAEGALYQVFPVFQDRCLCDSAHSAYASPAVMGNNPQAAERHRALCS